MNAIVNSNAAPRATTQGLNKFSEFKMLLKREIWEHRGAIIWTPLALAALQLVVTLIAGGTAWYKIGSVRAPMVVLENGREMAVNVTSINHALSKLTASEMLDVGRAIDLFYFASSTWPLLVAGIVAFFYCLGALYDERRDRSILFWKSMPVSDAQTVLSKLVTAVVVIPGIAFLVSVALVTLYSLLVGAILMLNGDAGSTLWGHTSPLKVIGSILSSFPIHAIWALPAAAWLLLCSSFAKRLPILWAVVVPLILGLVILWFEAGVGDNLQMVENYFRNIVYRILPSIVPGSFAIGLPEMEIDPTRNLMPYTSEILSTMYGVLLRMETWLGAAAAAVMTYVTIQIRRRNGAL